MNKLEHELEGIIKAVSALTSPTAAPRGYKTLATLLCEHPAKDPTVIATIKEQTEKLAGTKSVSKLRQKPNVTSDLLDT